MYPHKKIWYAIKYTFPDYWAIGRIFIIICFLHFVFYTFIVFFLQMYKKLVSYKLIRYASFHKFLKI